MYDGHGNVVRTENANSNATLSGWQWRGVWGETDSNHGGGGYTDVAGKGYCGSMGHPEDSSGLIYMRARYYDSSIGRFLSEDPAKQGDNWFLYCLGNPVNYLDKSGKFAIALTAELIFTICVVIIVLGGIGAGSIEIFDQIDDTGSVYSWGRVLAKTGEGMLFAALGELFVAGMVGLPIAGIVLIAIIAIVSLVCYHAVCKTLIDENFPEKATN